MEKIFKALAHEKRLNILKWLRDPVGNFPPQTDGDLLRDGVCVVNIANKLGVKQPTATQHLKILTDAGLILSKRIGQWTFITRNEEAIRNLKKIIGTEL